MLVGGEEDANISAHSGLKSAIGTIILADVVMSLDNVVAVAGAADGHIMMIAIGIAISIPIMIFGSKFIVKAMDKYSWIGYVGSGILAWTAGEMIFKDKQLAAYFRHPKWDRYVFNHCCLNGSCTGLRLFSK